MTLAPTPGSCRTSAPRRLKRKAGGRGGRSWVRPGRGALDHGHILAAHIRALVSSLIVSAMALRLASHAATFASATARRTFMVCHDCCPVRFGGVVRHPSATPLTQCVVGYVTAVGLGVLDVLARRATASKRADAVSIPV